MNEEFYFQMMLTLLGIVGGVICVILGWYLKKRETCNRRKEDLQEKLVKKVDEIYNDLHNHIENSKREIKRINRLENKLG